jgi:prepilin-type processing-associated H-X9-DG protein
MGTQSGAYPNWRVGLLPLIEQQNAYAQLSSPQGYYGHTGFSGNTILYTLNVDVFNCPSSRFASRNPTDVVNSAQGSVATAANVSQLADYVGVSGFTPDPSGRTSVCTGDFLIGSGSICNSGMLVPYRSVGIRDCTDGTTNVIIIAEQSGQVNGTERSANCLGAWFSWGNWNQPIDTPWPLTTSMPSAYPGGITAVRYAPNSYPISGAPSQASSACAANTIINSFHAGGIHVLMTDGSVRFLSNNISMTTLAQLCCRDDGGVVGEF